MKKSMGLLAVVLMSLPMIGQAEPISFEQAANVTGMTGIQIGFDYECSYEKFEQDGVQTIENNLTNIPIFVRFGFPVLEIKLSTPYGDLKDNIDSAEDKDFSGIRNIGLGLKTPLLPLPVFTLATGLNTSFPTADPQYYIFGEGLKLEPFLAADLDIMIMKLHANIAYEYRSGYKVDIDPFNLGASGELTLEPGDAIKFAFGAEISTGTLFHLHLELIGTQYGTIKFDGSEIPDSAGRTMSLVPGIRLQKGPFKAKFGVVIPVDEKDDRPKFGYAPRSDWKIITGASLLFGL